MSKIQKWARVACLTFVLCLLQGTSTVNIQIKSADQSTTSGTYVDVSELSFEVGANTTYLAQWVLVISTASNLAGAQLAINGPASPTAVTVTITSFTAVGTPSATNSNAYDSGLDALTSPTGSSRSLATIRATILNGATAGTVSARLRTSDGSTSITVHAGSSLVYNTSG